jgi:HD superfamily phosphohydrolase
MGKPFQIRDAVHSFISLTDEEVRLVNSPVFQRLRGIRQLALANLVYPGALHTRFDHSLGVCHIARLMAEQLALKAGETRLVRLTALLHDLGHGPFSHVSENALELYGDRSKLPASQKKEKIHEVVTGHLIRHDKDITGVLGKDTCEDIADLLADGKKQRVLHAIVSGPLDADKQDYLLRDSLFCGVPYGHYDLHQLLRSIVPVGGKGGEELMIDPNGLHAVEQYVLAKYYLTTNVYRHRVRLITDQMLTRAIVLGIEQDCIKELKRLYEFDNSDRFYSNYCRWDDSQFFCAFGNGDYRGTLCGRLLQRLVKRHLLKQVFAEHIRNFTDPRVKDALMRLCKPDNREVRNSLEAELAKALSKCLGVKVDRRFVIVNAFDIKSVRTTSRNDEGSILVAKVPDPVAFEEESYLFKSINAEYTEGSVEVYAPTDWSNHTERGRLQGRLRGPVLDVIKAISK